MAEEAAVSTAEGAELAKAAGIKQGDASAAPASEGGDSEYSITDYDGRTRKFDSKDSVIDEGAPQPDGAGEGKGEKPKKQDASVKEGDSEPPEKPEGKEGEQEKQDEGDEPKKEEAATGDDLVEESRKAGDSKGVTKRIERAVTGQREAERKVDVLSQENADMKKRLEALERGEKPEAGEGDDKPEAGDKGKPQRPAAPKMDDFENVEDYETAREKYDSDDLPAYFEQLSAWDTDQRIKAWETTQARKARKESDDKLIDAAVKKYPDFREIALDNGLEYTDVMAEVLFGSQKFADVAYHLGMHPEEQQRIAKLPATQQVYEMARIEISLQGKDSKSSSTDKGGEPRPGKGDEGKAPESAGKGLQPRTTAADEPINPLSGAGGGSGYDPATADPETYIREENRRELARRRGGT